MAINGLSSGISHQAFAAAITKNDPKENLAALDAQSKSLDAFSSRFQKPVVNQEVKLGTGPMADRQIGVGSGADRARASEAGAGSKNFFSNLSSRLGALVSGFATAIKRLFTPSAKEPKPALAEAPVSQKPHAAAAAGPETRRTGASKGLPNASGNPRISGFNQKLARLQAGAEGFHAQAVALRKAQQGRF